jgi:trans-aconitate methyltransferase
MVGHAELNAEVLIALLDEATDELVRLTGAGRLEVGRILDIGCGPGVATCVLAQRFPGATVVAADGSPEMLANVEARAARLGLAGRVTTRQIQLPDGIDDLGPAELVWASLVLHHVGDEADALRRLRGRLPEGGLLALAEFGDRSRVVPDDVDLGHPGLWSRLDGAQTAWLADMRAELPGATESADYATMLAGAGFEVLVDRMLTARLDPPLDPTARQAAVSHLRMIRDHAEGYAEPEDLAALDQLLDDDDPAGLLRRPDALLHASRRLLIGRAG